jgi:anti-sigma B factor antagonist
VTRFESSPHVTLSNGPARARFADGFGFEARVFEKDGATVVAVVGEVDMATADLFRQAIDVACAGGQHVVIDLVDTTFIDSSGLAVVVRAHGELGPHARAVVVRSASPLVTRTFALTGLDHLIAS